MITQLTMTNCGPFRGTHTIKLGPGAYAIVAKHEKDPRKSNGVGKSFLLEMIDFAITGRFNKSRGYDADGWISTGEKDASVALTLEGGIIISRSKRRGQSTQVRLMGKNVGEAAQDGAASGILKYLALDADDFRNAAYFEQRKMAKLVDPEQTNPRDRLDIVSGWFGLGLAERSEELASERAAEHEKELTKLITMRTVALSRFAHDEEHDIEALEVVLVTAKCAVEKLGSEHTERKLIEEAEETVDEQQKRIKQGLRLRDDLAKLDGVEKEAAAAREELTKLGNAVANLTDEVRRKKKVALGMFDGACPVAPIECPAKEKINKDRKGTEGALKEAQEALTRAVTKQNETIAKHQSLMHRERALLDMKRDIDRTREEVREYAPEVKKAKEYLITAPDFVAGFACVLDYQKDFNERMTAARQAVTDVTVKIGIAKSNATARERAEKEVAQLDLDIEKRRNLVTQHLRARAIFRQAQRNVAERNLAFVEEEANYQLADAGIALRVTARWEREASGPAKTCETCGAAFPSSAKVKACERCGSARGSHTVQRLDFMLSDRSGALNDLGGVTMQLAAGAWLIGNRHSPWSTAMLDEPFAACDSFNRRALATQLLKLLNRGVWRQAIVISHSPDTVDVYQHKIVVIANADGSRRIEQL